MGEADAEKKPPRRSDDPTGEKLMCSHAARLPLATGTRADHEVAASVRNRLDEAWDQLRAVAAIAVEKYDDVTILGGLGTGLACPAVTALAQANDACTGVSRALYGVICA